MHYSDFFNKMMGNGDNPTVPWGTPLLHPGEAQHLLVPAQLVAEEIATIWSLYDNYRAPYRISSIFADFLNNSMTVSFSAPEGYSAAMVSDPSMLQPLYAEYFPSFESEEDYNAVTNLFNTATLHEDGYVTLEGNNLNIALNYSTNELYNLQ